MFDISKALIPKPQSIEACGCKKCIGIESKPYYKLIIEEAPSEVFSSAVELLKKRLLEKTAADTCCCCEKAYPIYVKINSSCGDRADSYTVDISEEKAELCGYDAGGLYYAAVTFTKLIFSERGGIYVPICKIKDYPDFTDRGLFLEDRFGSDFMTLDEYKDAIDYLSEMKYNQVTIGVYGCWCKQYDHIISEYLYIPFEKYPQLQTPRYIKYYSVNERKWVYKNKILPTMFEEDYFGELIKYSQSKNVKIKPLFNSLGHNTLIPRVFPEISAKDEKGEETGRGFCTRNQQTYDIMFGIYDEIIDRYLTPNGIDAIQIGLDEVSYSNFCECEKCRGTERSELMIEYIINLLKYLKTKNMKSVYIYYDMLMNFEVDFDALAQRFKDEGVYDIAVIDWWSYTREENLFRARPLSSAFRGISKPFTGYYHWVIPMEYNNSIYGCAKLAKKYGFEGIESYSGFDYCYDRPFKYQADLSWNISGVDASFAEKSEEFYSRYAYQFCPENYEAAHKALDFMKVIMNADTAACHMNTFEYYWYTYERSGQPYPRNFPGGVFSAILGSRDMYMEYFAMIKENAAKAIEFFKSNHDSDKFINDTWLAIAEHYYTYADEYETITKLYEDKPCKCVILSELKRLLKQHEAFMSTVESSRIKANQYTYLRNHTITRQFYIDLINYFETCEEPVLEITDFDYVKSEVYNFLR